MVVVSHRAARRVAAALLSVAFVLGGSACGFDAQTLQPYTPAAGVNVDIGQTVRNEPAVQVRNLMVLTRTQGEGFLSATIIVNAEDQLIAVSGAPTRPNDNLGTPFTVNLAEPVTVEPGTPVVLTEQTAITLSSPDLQAGLGAKLSLEFSHAGSVDVVAPVIDANQQDYQTVSPSPAPTPAETPGQ